MTNLKYTTLIRVGAQPRWYNECEVRRTKGVSVPTRMVKDITLVKDPFRLPFAYVDIGNLTVGGTED